MAVLAAAPAAAQANCTLTLVVVPCIELSVPASYAWGSLNPGTSTSAQQTAVVSSNLGYGVRVSADRADGRMAEFNGSGYVSGGRTLSSPLQFGLTSIDGSARTPSWTSFSGSDQTLVSGRGHTGCVIGLLCGTDDLGVTYRQSVSYADRRASPNSYRIRVTYTASHGW
jgi:hypothetical protein